MVPVYEGLLQSGCVGTHLYLCASVSVRACVRACVCVLDVEICSGYVLTQWSSTEIARHY